MREPDTLSPSPRLTETEATIYKHLGTTGASLQTPSASKSSLTLFPPSPQPSALPPQPSTQHHTPTVCSAPSQLCRHPRSSFPVSELRSPLLKLQVAIATPTGLVLGWLLALGKGLVAWVSFLRKSRQTLKAPTILQACESLHILMARLQGHLHCPLPLLIFPSLPSQNPEAGMAPSSGIISPSLFSMVHLGLEQVPAGSQRSVNNC